MARMASIAQTAPSSQVIDQRGRRQAVNGGGVGVGGGGWKQPGECRPAGQALTTDQPGGSDQPGTLSRARGSPSGQNGATQLRMQWVARKTSNKEHGAIRSAPMAIPISDTA